MMMERQLEVEGEIEPVAVTIKLLANSVQIVSSNDHLV